MAKNRHHITYDPEWIVELTGWEHKVVTHLQRLKPNKANLRRIENLLHAVTHEWNRMKCNLDRIEEKNINP